MPPISDQAFEEVVKKLNRLEDEFRSLKQGSIYAPVPTPTVALLHFDGTDASTSIVDERGHVWVPGGNAQIDTAQYKFGGASVLFDGVSDNIAGDGSQDFAFGLGDFTIEFWLRSSSFAQTQIMYDSRLTVDGAFPTIYLAVTTGQLIYFTNTGNQITGSNLSLNTWYHVAVARKGTATKMFLNGAQDGSTYTDTTNYQNNAGRPMIGAYGITPSTAEFSGWIDELRITKGICRYTDTFTPQVEEF